MLTSWRRGEVALIVECVTRERALPPRNTDDLTISGAKAKSPGLDQLMSDARRADDSREFCFGHSSGWLAR
jgi:hypothetical protein